MKHMVNVSFSGISFWDCIPFCSLHENRKHGRSLRPHAESLYFPLPFLVVRKADGKNRSRSLGGLNADPAAMLLNDFWFIRKKVEDSICNLNGYLSKLKLQRE